MLRAKNKVKKRPIERHSTAAWANISQEMETSKVSLPSRQDVEFAREWVNKNQK